jgi:uncharacterized protein YPO0396
VWVQVSIYEVSTGGISSGTSHFVDRYVALLCTACSVALNKASVVTAVGRSECLELLQTMKHESPWVTGYQKVVALTYWDTLRYGWFDTKT